MVATEQGTLIKWDDEKGYGFIKRTSGGKDVFLHISDLLGRDKQPIVGDLLAYTVVLDDSGRPQAQNVCFVGQPAKQTCRNKSVSLPTLVWVVVGGFMAALTFVCFRGRLSFMIFGVYAVMSLLTYIIYRMDKRSAESGEWRISEAFLHLLELAGGWPGAMIAQWKIHHKNRKPSYQATFWFIVLLHLGAISYLAFESMHTGSETSLPLLSWLAKFRALPDSEAPPGIIIEDAKVP